MRSDLLRRLRSLLAAVLPAAALLWLLAAAFFPGESVWLPMAATVAAAVSVTLLQGTRRPWLAPAVWLGLCVLALAVFHRTAASGFAALFNGFLDMWKHILGKNFTVFSVTDSHGAMLLLCLLGAVVGVWSAGFARSRSAVSFWSITAVLVLLCVLFAPQLSAGWLLVAALTELLAFAVYFVGSDSAGAWLRITAVLLLSALVLNGWQQAKPAFLEQAVLQTQRAVQRLRYGSNESAGLPEGDLRAVGPRQTTQDTVLKITMESPASYYLRGFVGECYQNNRWLPLESDALYAASDNFYWLHQDGFYPQTQIAAAAAAVQPDLVPSGSGFTVENVGASSQYLYAPYELMPDSAGLDASSIGDRTLLASGLRGQRSYTLSVATGLITRYQRICSALARTQAEETPFLRSEADYNAFAYENYTDIPSDIRSYLAGKLGEYAVSDGESHFDYQSAKQNILFYLTSYVEYEEQNITSVGEGLDFVLSFLDGTQKGYSVHYATAAAMMFRYYGIPARYVEGYLISKENAQSVQSGQTLLLDGSHAHSWVEYYQDGVGWLPFEVTPPYFSAMEQAEQFQDISGLIGQQPKDNVVDNVEDDRQNNNADDPSLMDFWLKHRLQILLVLAVLAALVLLALFAAWLLWERRKTARRKAGFQGDDLPAAICAIFDYMMDVLRSRGLKAKNCPPAEYAEFVDEDLRERYCRVAALWEEARFSAHPMREEQRREALSLEEEIWGRTWREAGFLRRIRLKYVLFL